MKKIQQIPARHKIADELKAAILSGEIVADTELVQENMAHLLGVSRTPVREAFQLLEKDGFISLVNSKKAIVRRFETSDVIEHYELRALLEGEVAYKAAQRQCDTTRLRELIERMDECVGQDEFIGLNHAFHHHIWECAQSPKYGELIMHLWNRIPAQLVSYSKENHMKANREHKAIVEALESYHPHHAKEAMKTHILRTMHDYLKQHQQPL